MQTVSDLDEKEIVELLGQDVTSTLGMEHLDFVRSSAREHRWITDDRAWYIESVVTEVQQYFHDCFIDTTWPACPVHPNHPMWFEDGWWLADGRPVVRLGDLGSLLK